MKRSGFRGFLTASVVAAGVLASSNAMAAVDMFIKIGDITGESTDAKHSGEIDVLAWSWGESTGTARTRKGLLPPACIQDLSFTKYVDLASPDLIMNGVSGEVASTARLTMRKAGVTPFEFLRLDLSNVSVVSYQTGGSGGEDRLTENVTLHFDAMKGVYRKQDSKGTVVEVPFDIAGGCPQ